MFCHERYGKPSLLPWYWGSPSWGLSFLKQEQVCLDLLKRIDMLGVCAIQTILSQKHTLHDLFGSQDIGAFAYRIVVTTLYLTLTRPDISYIVNLLCQFMQCLTSIHWSGVKRVLWYIAGTSTLDLRISTKSSLNLVGFSDADWARCPLTRWTTSGLFIFLGSNCIS